MLMAAAVLTANFACAGGGPENILLLVNTSSLNSKTVANHYIALRKIPPSNVVYVDWRGGIEGAQATFFSSIVLQPAIDAIGERGLGAQIDSIIYSCDFPWKIGLQPMFPDEKFSLLTRPVASTTGFTYLWQYVRDKNPAIVMPTVNWYVSPKSDGNVLKCQQMNKVESRGFHSRYFWTPDGSKSLDPSKGQSYLLSTMLGVTTGRGNTVDEILAYLKRAVEADGMRPRGTFYYMKNSDIRSVTRDSCFAAAADDIKRLGVSAAVLPGVLPPRTNDVLGIMTGAADLDIAKSGLRFLPGAICDNLTSYGGMLEAKPWQTPLSDFLRAGATGASGTVFEPTSMQAKFALPSLFIHYARGCSFAESYYQSVAGPYMLLIVGDPLCQPFAVAPKVDVEGIKPGQEVKGTITLKATVTTAPLTSVDELELFVDGRLIARYSPKSAPQLDTEKLVDGYHELRIVAINADAIETRGRQILPIVVNNHGRKLELAALEKAVAATDVVKITARQPGATAIVVRQNRREVARFQGGEGEASVSAATLGRGPVVLQAESEGPAATLSQPLVLEIH